jgi:hypothetical protein
MNLREWVNKTMNETAQKYYEIVFLQGENAEEPLKILDDKGEDAAIKYLEQWDYGSEMEHTPEEQPWGDGDETFEKDDYVMSWNSRLGYIGLVRKVKEEEKEPPKPPELPEKKPEETPAEPGKPEPGKPEAKAEAEGIKALSVPEKHQLKVALDTLKMSRAGATIMGGMNHTEAVAFLRKVGYTDSKIKQIIIHHGHTKEEAEKMMEE